MKTIIYYVEKFDGQYFNRVSVFFKTEKQAQDFINEQENSNGLTIESSVLI